ncbi:Retrovirus-related Pol polyprotein from transposon TNT 1-94 [Vitis vinifera]|uniref:Retrovirus-related Pol polyprotein from transposon TNT 1-94 n=1 Tax=Vitis vinifera TaxID=29760 RepID=A0A438ICV8_VITVI|nr:Retrovirus-related Pol polyprotein from transposon TNT 1-94 [Vitis vinifera]
MNSGKDSTAAPTNGGGTDCNGWGIIENRLDYTFVQVPERCWQTHQSPTHIVGLDQQANLTPSVTNSNKLSSQKGLRGYHESNDEDKVTGEALVHQSPWALSYIPDKEKVLRETVVPMKLQTSAAKLLWWRSLDRPREPNNKALLSALRVRRGCARVRRGCAAGAPRVRRGCARVRRGCDAGAPRVRRGCARVRRGCAAGAPRVRRGCAAGAPRVRRGCAAGAPRVRRGCARVRRGCAAGARGCAAGARGCAAGAPRRVRRGCAAGAPRVRRGCAAVRRGCAAGAPRVRAVRRGVRRGCAAGAPRVRRGAARAGAPRVGARWCAAGEALVCLWCALVRLLVRTSAPLVRHWCAFGESLQDFALREDRPSDLKPALLSKEAIRGAIPKETQTKSFLDKIANRFAANEKVQTSTILSKLVSMRYKGKENIREYIMEMSNLVTRLKALKLELSEDILVHLVLISLPTQFKEERLKQEKIESAHLASTSQGFEINLAVVPTDTWWIDMGATTHISVTMQGCLRSRMPTDGERYIYVGNGNKAAVKAIGLFRLQLDSGCTLDLEETFVVPSFRRNLIFVSCLDKFGYCCSFGNGMSQSLDVFKNFKAKVENQLSKKIKAVRSDRGGEYYGRYDGSGEQRPGPFAKYLMECGIVPQYTMPGTPSQNGCSREAKPVPSKAVAKTPYELWTSKKPSIRHLHVWSCPAEARPYKPNEKKLDSRTVSCYFVGYSERSRGFKFYDPSTRSFFETGNAKFIEDVELSGRESLRKLITRIQDTLEIPPAQVMELIQVHQEFDMGLEDDPISVSQVKQSSDSEKWIEAMKDEMKSMKDNGVWDLVELPKGVKPIGCKWIFKTKWDSKGNIVRYKARLVAKGFTQKEGIDYKETFSPVSSKDSFRIIMTLVAHYDLELHQMDVKTVFLNGNIDETIYMVQPENFESNDSKQLVCRLKGPYMV